MIRRVLKIGLGVVLTVCVAFGLFVLVLEHPATKGPTRCWMQETLYTQSWEDAPAGTPVIAATLVTDPVRDMCDAADDPAILVADGALHVLGTNKQRSLNVYDGEGQLVSRADELGAPNNVDLRRAFGGVIAIASDKDDSELEAFWFDPASATLARLPGAPFAAQREEEVYGTCLYRSGEKLYAFTTDKSGLIVQYEIERADGSNGAVFATRLLRELRVGTQPEGCVVDDRTGTLFVGEEDVGIWRFAAGAEAETQGALIAKTGAEGPLTADVEGLAVYAGDDNQKSYLVASSQGDNTYAVFDLAAPHAFRGRFQVTHKGELIGDTDGLEVTSTPIGPRFPEGVLVIQDGLVRTGGKAGAQSQTGQSRYQRFAYVSWRSIREAIGLAGD
ncbi:MAG: phytase [Pseudomonadota bacterium]